MPASSKDLKEVTIRVDKSHRADLDGIVTQLRSLGLEDVQVLSRFLTIHGRIQLSSVPRLQQVKGVASVRESKVLRAL